MGELVGLNPCLLLALIGVALIGVTVIGVTVIGVTVIGVTVIGVTVIGVASNPAQPHGQQRFAFAAQHVRACRCTSRYRPCSR